MMKLEKNIKMEINEYIYIYIGRARERKRKKTKDNEISIYFDFLLECVLARAASGGRGETGSDGCSGGDPVLGIPWSQSLPRYRCTLPNLEHLEQS